ncbi:MAG: tryptophan synthase subunit alpha [Desulfobacterales bacterium]|nr:tryptophan synthase subunit alpha [Desulfobacterales bacterium]
MNKPHPLETYIRDRRKTKDILLMTHIVLGYPDFETSLALVEEMVAAGVDLMELQIPFSEPMADGPVILAANQAALDRGTTLAHCLDFSREVTRKFPIPFLFMGYANTFYRYGLDRMAQAMAEMDIAGAIVPDFPPEESGVNPGSSQLQSVLPGQNYLGAMGRHQRAPIHILTPQTPTARMEFLDRHSQGFIYCTARKGVTGKATAFSPELTAYLAQCRETSRLPLAVGFGVRERADIDFLRGKADIAVMGSETIRVLDDQGVAGVGKFIKGLN